MAKPNKRKRKKGKGKEDKIGKKFLTCSAKQDEGGGGGTKERAGATLTRTPAGKGGGDSRKKRVVKRGSWWGNVSGYSAGPSWREKSGWGLPGHKPFMAKSVHTDIKSKKTWVGRPLVGEKKRKGKAGAGFALQSRQGENCSSKDIQGTHRKEEKRSEKAGAKRKIPDGWKRKNNRNTTV